MTEMEACPAKKRQPLVKATPENLAEKITHTSGREQVSAQGEVESLKEQDGIRVAAGDMTLTRWKK